MCLNDSMVWLYRQQVENQITKLHLARHKPDLHIKPGLDNAGLFDFHKAEEIIRIGEIATRKKLEAIL